jgi:hypothetical protein
MAILPLSSVFSSFFHERISHLDLEGLRKL